MEVEKPEEDSRAKDADIPPKVMVSPQPEKYGASSLLYAFVATCIEVIVLFLGEWTHGGSVVWMIGSAVAVALFAVSLVFAVRGKKIASPGSTAGLIVGIIGCLICSFILVVCTLWNIVVVWNPNVKF
jgi:hypothetical protein